MRTTGPEDASGRRALVELERYLVVLTLITPIREWC
jgi:hypothetical protein